MTDIGKMEKIVRINNTRWGCDDTKVTVEVNWDPRDACYVTKVTVRSEFDEHGEPRIATIHRTIDLALEYQEANVKSFIHTLNLIMS